ncbi:MAG: SPOR domain-containing protein [Alphaproteobacteria bacterium]|nr:SPOR domain-containing protein [Alphaproteobacteria bacterium]
MTDTDKKEDENIGSFYMGRSRTSPQPRRLFPPGVLTTIAVLAFAGIVWYAYPRGAEKYSDIDVPVVKADTAPIKAEPVDPGGMEVPHQDSTVFEPLDKNASGEVEKLLPAPEEPVDKDTALKSEADANPPAEAAKLAPSAALDLQAKDAKDGMEKMPLSEPEIVPPAAVEAAPPAPAPAVKAEETKAAPPVEDKAVGTKYIQLGSFRDAAGAKKDWERIKAKNPDLLGKLTMKTEKVDLPAKGIYYRLQAGKVTEDRAKEICAALKKSVSGGCIVVKN